MTTLAYFVVILVAMTVCLRATAVVILRAYYKGTLTAHRFATVAAIGVGSMFLLFISLSLVFATVEINLDIRFLILLFGVPLLTVVTMYPMALAMYQGIFKKHMDSKLNKNS